AAATHRLCRFQQRDIDAWFAAHRLRHRIAYGLDETVDQSGFQVRTRRRVDPAAGDEAVAQRLIEHRLPARGVALDLCERTRHTPTDIVNLAFITFRVFLQQYVDADLLRRQGEMGVVELHRGSA